MLRVLLVTKNTSLAEFCRRNSPGDVRLNVVKRLNLRTETAHSIILFDSAILVENSDAVIARAADELGAKDGAVALAILMNTDHQQNTFSLFPENMNLVQAILHYRYENGKIGELTAKEFHWFIEQQKVYLKQRTEHILATNENIVLTDRLMRVNTELRGSIRFPAFMQGRSQAITKFRAQFFSIISESPYLLITGKDEMPMQDFLEYYCSLREPEARTDFRLVDLTKIAKHLQAQTLWPTRKGKVVTKDAQVICVRGIERLSWQNQTALLQQLAKLRDDESSPHARTGAASYIFVAHSELQGDVRRGQFRQELLSLLKRAEAILPPLYERPDDITQISAEYIQRRGFTSLNERMSEIATNLIARFDLSSGYLGLFTVLDLMHDLQKSNGVPVFEFLNGFLTSDAYLAARSFLREEVEPNAASLFQNLAGGEKDALSLDYVERNYIAAVCERYAWQVSDAARHLRISRKTLYDKMRRYKLARPDSSSARRIKKVS